MNSLEQEVRNKAAQVDALLRHAERASQADCHCAEHAGAVEAQASWRGNFADSVESQTAGGGASLEAAVAEEAVDGTQPRATWRGNFVDDSWADYWFKA
ncbi:MAG: hypothetical protein JOZ96_24655 [Acidobacteria bacterium]|nr:hypothetical protein [Acidobacteriota bacterium]